MAQEQCRCAKVDRPGRAPKGGKVSATQVAMKRPALVTGVTLLQFLLGFLWLGITVYLLFISRSPDTKNGGDPAGTILGLEIAAAFIAPGAVFGLVAAYALGKDKLWGWWMSLIINAVFALMLIYSMIDDGWDNLDPELVGFTLLSLLPLILLLLPGVRQFFWRTPTADKAANAVSASVEP